MYSERSGSRGVLGFGSQASIFGMASIEQEIRHLPLVDHLRGTSIQLPERFDKLVIGSIIKTKWVDQN